MDRELLRAIDDLTSILNVSFTTEDIKRELGLSERSTLRDTGHVVAQLFVYDTLLALKEYQNQIKSNEFDPGFEQKLLYAGVLRGTIMQELAEKDRIEALVPMYYWSYEQIEFLPEYWDHSLVMANDRRNLKKLESMFARLAADPPEGLITHLFIRFPSDAVRCLINAYGTSYLGSPGSPSIPEVITLVEIHLLEFRQTHTPESMETAQESLRSLLSLAEDGQWHVRAYVAAMLGHNLELRGDALTRALQNDRHPIVRKIASKSLDDETYQERQARVERERLEYSYDFPWDDDSD